MEVQGGTRHWGQANSSMSWWPQGVEEEKGEVGG